jgi:hypothetical protein
MSELAKALVKVQKEIKNPAFDNENPYFSSRFASLKAVIEATIPVANKHGISVVQELKGKNHGTVAVVTHLIHDSGESLQFGPLTVLPTKLDPQGQGSAATYARRYHLMSVFGVVGEDDDDGNIASESSFKSKQAKTIQRDRLRGDAKASLHDKVRETWNGLNNDQRAELWASYAKADQKMIQESLNETKQ